MVRVQQPPGGKTHIEEELAPRQPNVRVLKPPGGGSSISFGEDDDIPIKPKSAPLQAAAAAPKNDNHQEPSPKAETNGTTSPPQSPKDNATATKENNPSTATNGVAAVNGTVTNGTVTNGALTNGTSTSGSSTPSSSRVDTQNRLFGQDASRQDSANRRVRDHHRSNIFTDESNKAVNAPKPANPVGNGTPEPKTPEAKTPEQPQPQFQQKQRIPPGGFSSKLW